MKHNRKNRMHYLALTTTFAAGLVLMGCGSEEVQTYEVPKGSETISSPEGTPAAPPRQPAAAAPREEVAESTMTWELPDHWREHPDNPPMRLATFLADGPEGTVEIALSRFPGDVGGVLANINRWRSQVGLDPVTAADLDDLLELFSNDGTEGYFVHLEGPNTHMLAAGIFEVAINQTWFVRVTTDAASAGALKDEVLEFAKSFKADEESSGAPAY